MMIQFVAGMLLSFGLSVVMAMWRVVAAPGPKAKGQKGQKGKDTPMAEEWPRAVKGIWGGKLEVLDRLLFVLRNQHANGSPANQMVSRQR